MKKEKLWWVVRGYSGGVLVREAWIRGRPEAKQRVKEFKTSGLLVELKQSNYTEDDR